MAAEKKTRLADIEWWKRLPRIGDWEEEPVDYVVDRMIGSETLTMLSGKPGTYKSFLALDLARSVAAGRRFAGLETAKRNVLYVDLENAANLVARRRTLYRIPNAETFLYWGRWAKLPFIGIEARELLDYCEQFRPFLIFDSLIRFHRAKENANEEMARVMGAFLAMARRGATVLLIHHQGKDSLSLSRGAIEIEAAPDINLHVEREAGSRTIKLRQTKNRLDEERAWTLRWTENGFAAEIDIEEPPARANGRWKQDNFRETPEIREWVK